MRRGELYRVRRPPGDPKPARVFVVVSRQPLIDSTYSTVICAPVFTQFHGLPSQVAVSAPEGLKHSSAIQCDGLMSLEKSRLTDYVGELASDTKKDFLYDEEFEFGECVRDIVCVGVDDAHFFANQVHGFQFPGVDRLDHLMIVESLGGGKLHLPCRFEPRANFRIVD